MEESVHWKMPDYFAISKGGWGSYDECVIKISFRHISEKKRIITKPRIG